MPRGSIILPIAVRRWLKARNQKEKLILGVVAGIAVRSGVAWGILCRI